MRLRCDYRRQLGNLGKSKGAWRGFWAPKAQLMVGADTLTTGVPVSGYAQPSIKPVERFSGTAPDPGYLRGMYLRVPHLYREEVVYDFGIVCGAKNG
jgi:hypothetical protein